MITLKPVKSSNIERIGHDPATNELHVMFKGGATHIYKNVSAKEHDEIAAAKSIGSHFHAHIRNSKESRKATDDEKKVYDTPLPA